MAKLQSMAQSSFLNNFLGVSLNRIFLDFRKYTKEATELCSLAELRFDNDQEPDYSKPEIQQLYLLRFLPAYVIEYLYIYERVLAIDHLNKKELNILSIGCGCLLDLYGLYIHLFREGEEKKYKINYFGYDIVKWNYSDLLESNFRKVININDVTELESFPESNYDIVIFPKSISGFKSKFDSFLNVLKRTTFSNKKLIVISSIRDKNDRTDKNYMNRVLDILRLKKFNILEGETCFDEGKQAINLREGLAYDDNIKNFITNLEDFCKKHKGNDCNSFCSNVLKRSNPVLMTNYMKYQIFRLEK